MRKTPPVLLLLIVIGVPCVIVLVMLWPKIQERIVDNREIDGQERINQLDDDQSEKAEPDTDDDETDGTNPATPMKQVAVQPSAVEQAVAANREKLQAAKTSYERLVQATDSDLLQTYGSDEWRDVQALASQASQLSQPLSAVAKYSEAETLLRELRADLPNRQLIGELTELQSRSQPLSFLSKLADISNSRPAMRGRLAPFWAEVSTWDTQKWLTLIQRECEEVSPKDGGYADVYHALADFHRDAGREQAALDAEQTAWGNALRMTDARRAAESAIRSLLRLPDSTPSSTRASRIEEATNLARDVADTHDRMKLLAEVASLSPQPQAESLLKEIHQLAVASRIDLRLYWPQIYKCRVLAEIRSPSDVFEVCKSIPKYNGRIGFDPFAANTMSYAHAASAAARTDQPSDFWKAMLLAEAQQLDSTGIELRDQRACAVLASADLRQGNFRRATFSAMNLHEHSLRPPLLFPVMKDAPQYVPAFVAKPLITLHGSNDLGCVAVAAYLPTLAADFDSESELVSWILGHKMKSVRTASMIGFARHKVSPLATDQPQRIQPPTLDVTNARRLLETAEAEAKVLQEPLERAWAYLWVAACWSRLDQPASYSTALTRFDDAVYSAWKSHWRNSEDDRGAGRYRSNRQRDQQLKQLIECYCIAAELQAFVLDDPRRAIENVINAARASQPLNDANSNLKIRLWMIAEAIHRDCGVPFGTLESVHLPPNNYYRMLLAARQQDHNAVTAMVRKIETQGPGTKYKAPDYLARAYAELAISSAKNDDLATYRSARRKAAGIVNSQGADDSIMLPLYEADALAGEFALAMSRDRHYTPLPLYGTSGRTTAVLCCQLSRASRTDDAIEHLPSTSQPFYRLQAMHAAAAARSNSTPSEQLVRWLNEQTEQLDRIAVLCGLAYRKPIQ